MSEKVDLQIPLLSFEPQQTLKLKEFFAGNESGIIQIGSSYIQYNRHTEPQLQPIWQRTRSIFEIVNLPKETMDFLNQILKETPYSPPVKLNQAAGG